MAKCRIVYKFIGKYEVLNVVFWQIHLQMSIKDLNMIGPHHICVLYVATAGLQGPLMGSDEQEIVLLIFVIVDAVQNKVRIN